MGPTARTREVRVVMNIAVVGAQWGDEGKGKLVDMLASEHDAVVRYNGGANAGHSVVVAGTRYSLHLVPSGILYPGKAAVIGNGVVVDPWKLMDELKGLRERGVNTSGLMVSDRAHVVLPYHKVEDGLREDLLNRGAASEGGGGERQGATPTSGVRILVVDDNRDAADSLARLLKVMGNSVHTAHDGQEAVAAAREFRPHVVLCDIGLPKLNGYEACRLMKQQTWDEKMILIAVTGWGQDDDKRKAREAGFDHHMLKPVDPQVLINMLAGLNRAKG